MKRRTLLSILLFLMASIGMLHAQSSVPAVIPQNDSTTEYFSSFDRDVYDLVTTYANVYVGVAISVLNRLAVGLLVVVLATAGYEAVTNRAVLNLDYILRKAVVPYMFAIYVLRYWITPIPGLGVSFIGMFTNTAAELSAQANIKTLDTLYTLLLHVRDGIGLWAALKDPIDMFAWGLITFLLIWVKVAVFFITSIGFVGLGVGACIGPIFLLFYLFPPMRQKWFTWVEAMIKYAMYRIIGNLVIGVWCTFMVSFLNNALGGQYDLIHLMSNFISFAAMMIVFAISIFRIPHFVSDFNSGGSSGGHGVFGGLMAFARGMFL